MGKPKTKATAPEVVKVANADDLKQAKKKATKAKKQAVKTAKATKKTVAVPKQVLYLNEGVTGKKLTQFKRDANNAHKADQGSISYCIRRALEFGEADFMKSFKKYNRADVTPVNLLKHQTEYQKQFKNHCVWFVMGYIKKFYDAKEAKTTTTVTKSKTKDAPKGAKKVKTKVIAEVVAAIAA